MVGNGGVWRGQIWLKPWWLYPGANAHCPARNLCLVVGIRRIRRNVQSTGYAVLSKGMLECRSGDCQRKSKINVKIEVKLDWGEGRNEKRLG